MQYAPTLSKKDKASSGRYFLSSRTRRDQYVFNFSMSNRLSDGYPCRGVLHTPHIDSMSTLSPLAGRLAGRIQYAPTLSEKDEDSLGRCFPSSRTIRDEYVFNSIMSNRLSDRYPCRGVLHTPLNHSRKGYSIVRPTIVGRMQYAPTLPAEKSDFKGRRGVMFGTKRDKYVFQFSMSNRLSDGYPSRGAKEYALCAFIFYPRAPCWAFGGAYAIRPYPIGKR